jgi:tRNA1(Val) A37 N6-methylase TrmN6
LTSLLAHKIPRKLNFSKLVRISLFVALYASCSLLATGCVTPKSTVTEDTGYYSTREFEFSDKYKLVWYYNTKEDLRKNTPNRVLARNKEFLLRPDVRPPTINAIYLLENSTVNEGEEVLDISTGSGIHAIFAAEKAKRVVATDIHESAIENARTNARLHKVEDKIDFRVGDFFDPIQDGEKFDVFFFNIDFPFSVNDVDRNKLHERLFSQVQKYMKPNARIYFQTSFIKNLPDIYKMLNRYNFRIMEIRMENMPKYSNEPLFMIIKSNLKQSR